MDKRQPSGKAWINGFRLVYDARQIRRGRHKGQFEVWYFTGRKYRKTYVTNFKPMEATS